MYIIELSTSFPQSIALLRCLILRKPDFLTGEISVESFWKVLTHKIYNNFLQIFDTKLRSVPAATSVRKKTMTATKKAPSRVLSLPARIYLIFYNAIQFLG